MKSRLKSALQNERLLAILLALVVVFTVFRTVWIERETPLERESSELLQQVETALDETKSAYRSDLITSAATINKALPDPNAALPPPPAAKKRVRFNTKTDTESLDLLSTTEADYAIDSWHKLTRSSSVTAAEWRRLGIALALFRRPGALTALDHVGTAAVYIDKDDRSSQKRLRRLRNLQQNKTQNDATNPFGHGPVDIPYAQEKYTWQRLYGPAPIAKDEVPALRRTLEKLHLGWFEYIVVAQLYQKAGMYAEAIHTAKQAEESSNSVRFLTGFQGWSFVIGILLLIVLGVRALIRLAKQPGPPFPQHPYQSYPNQSYPNQSYPNQSYPNQSYPNQTYPSQPRSSVQYPMAQGTPPNVQFNLPPSIPRTFPGDFPGARPLPPQTVPTHPVHTSQAHGSDPGIVYFGTDTPPSNTTPPPGPLMDFDLPLISTNTQPTPVPYTAAPIPVPPASTAPEGAHVGAQKDNSNQNSNQNLVEAPDATLFPRAALLVAFIAYLIGHQLFGTIFGLLLRPFSGYFHSLDGTSLLRVESVLDYILYIPVLLVPLAILKLCAPFDPVTGRKLDFKTLFTRLGYHTSSLWRDLFATGYAYLLLLPGILLAGLLSRLLFSHFHTPVNPAEFEMLAAHNLLDRTLVIITASVCAPVVEETMFRGVLYSALRTRFGVLGAAALSAAIFAIVHPTLPGGFLPIWAIGFALALVYEKRRSLLPGMLLHGIHNGLIMLSGFSVFSQ